MIVLKMIQSHLRGELFPEGVSRDGDNMEAYFDKKTLYYGYNGFEPLKNCWCKKLNKQA